MEMKEIYKDKEQHKNQWKKQSVNDSASLKDPIKMKIRQV